MQAKSVRPRMLRFAPLILAAALVLGDSRPAAAAACFTELKSCFFSVALYVSWIDMWLGGLDCEVEFAECMRLALIGR
jgi:hypothetical protein